MDIHIHIHIHIPVVPAYDRPLPGIVNTRYKFSAAGLLCYLRSNSGEQQLRLTMAEASFLPNTIADITFTDLGHEATFDDLSPITRTNQNDVTMADYDKVTEQVTDCIPFLPDDDNMQSSNSVNDPTHHCDSNDWTEVITKGEKEEESRLSSSITFTNYEKSRSMKKDQTTLSTKTHGTTLKTPEETVSSTRTQWNNPDKAGKSSHNKHGASCGR